MLCSRSRVKQSEHSRGQPCASRSWQRRRPSRGRPPLPCRKPQSAEPSRADRRGVRQTQRLDGEDPLQGHPAVGVVPRNAAHDVVLDVAHGAAALVGKVLGVAQRHLLARREELLEEPHATASPRAGSWARIPAGCCSEGRAACGRPGWRGDQRPSTLPDFACRGRGLHMRALRTADERQAFRIHVVRESCGRVMAGRRE
ncbi:hypothetical protein B0J12DRAFT_84739 [Macrophomina phaseolina]|uniref:Uncharacterized protein n=1 Tax=Macrophomina phaseolina TaxID=35725 RepID=A0ABQ8GCC8_9PEZI|nr:hypothetical protein B0J12DRAFT_84739 [Macrophomina phaseolina]